MSSSNENIVSFHIAGDAFVDFFCFLDGDWPENGGDSRLEQPVKAYAGGSATNTATHLKSLVCHFMDQKPQVKLHTVLNPNDHYGELLIQHAKDHEFPIVNCLRENDTSSTGHCIAIVSGGERSFMTHQGSMQNFAVDDLDLTSIISTETNLHCHVAGFYNIPGEFLIDVFDSKVAFLLQNLTLRTTEKVSGTENSSRRSRKSADNGKSSFQTRIRLYRS